MSISSILKDAYSLIDRNKRSQLFWLLPLLIIQGLMDVVTVASIAPLILLIIQPELLPKSALLTSLYSSSGLDTQRFSLLLLGALVAFLIARHLSGRLISYYRSNVISTISSALVSRVISNFLLLPYSAYSDLKSTHELNRIVNLPTVFGYNILMPIATLLTEGCTVLFLSVLLLIYNPWAMVLVASVVAIAFGFYRMNQKKVRSVNEVIGKKYPAVLEKFMALHENLVELKLYQKESLFAERVVSANNELLEAQATRNKLVHQSIRLVETTAAICFCLLVAWLVITGSSRETAVILIGLFAAAFVRAVPSFNRMFTALLEMKSSTYVLDELKKYETGKPASRGTEILFKERISFDDLSFSYPGRNPVLRRLSLRINRNDRVALTGKSGGGKTTLLLILMRFLRETNGNLFVDGIKLNDQNVDSWRTHLAYVPQNAMILDGNLIDNITMGSKTDIVRIHALLVALGLGGWLSELPQGLSTRLGEKGITVSGGQRQRIAIARALYSDAEILLLDEMTNQLDAGTEQEVWSALKRSEFKNKTIIMITHHAGLLPEFDAVYELDNGTLTLLSTDEVDVNLPLSRRS
jgi:ABC-type bacteriocin/lantibiotic exporter with double-glycine peptidase domain